MIKASQNRTFCTKIVSVQKRDIVEKDIFIKNGLTIPVHEVEITTSRSGGPGGQHVNKSDTRVSIRWNVYNTKVLSDEQKMRVLNNLKARLTSAGDLIISSSESRSQLQNKEAALTRLSQELRTALHVPKKRTKTRVSQAKKEERVHAKRQRAEIKKMRSKKIVLDF